MTTDCVYEYGWCITHTIEEHDRAEEHEHFPRIVQQEEDGTQHGLCDCDEYVTWDYDKKEFVAK